MSAPTNLPRNRLLLALPSSNLKQLIPELQQIRCDREQILVDADSSLDHVFFPDSGVISAVAVYSDGGIIETATIGREGCTNVQAPGNARPITMRPTRGWLWRASMGYQRPSRKTSAQAPKSIGLTSAGTPMSPR
jgi:hypothetical protein